MAFNVNIVGLKELQLKISKLKDSGLKKEVTAIVEAGAKTFVRNAKRDAPVDLGVLRNSIAYEPLGNIKFQIVSGAKYSAYLELGTITKVDVPSELQAYASQFKGAGLRKSGGIYPRPYFFKQIPTVRKQIEAGVKAVTSSL